MTDNLPVLALTEQKNELQWWAILTLAAPSRCLPLG